MNNEEMKGILFVNEKKMSDKSPDYKGSTLINGKVYYISLWKRVGKESGKEFFSLSFKAKEETPKAKPTYKPAERVQEVAQAVGGKVEILDEKPISEDIDVPF